MEGLTAHRPTDCMPFTALRSARGAPIIETLVSALADGAYGALVLPSAGWFVVSGEIRMTDRPWVESLRLFHSLFLLAYVIISSVSALGVCQVTSPFNVTFANSHYLFCPFLDCRRLTTAISRESDTLKETIHLIVRLSRANTNNSGFTSNYENILHSKHRHHRNHNLMSQPHHQG